MVKFWSISFNTEILLFNDEEVLTRRIFFRCQVMELLEDVALPDLLLLPYAQQVSYYSVSALHWL